MAVYTAIDDPNLYFHTDTYTGNGSGAREITDLPFDPDLSWFKNREDTDSHHLFDRVRGAQKHIQTNNTNAEDTDSNSLYAFISGGYYVASSASVNASGEGIVVWNWLESATSGFDIVSYTGTGSARTISHSLSAIPHFMFIKNRDSASTGWYNYHDKLGNTDAVHFNATNATSSNSTIWNDTSPTSSVFSVGTNAGVNTNTHNIIAYLWSEKQGFSKFGSYTGNGNADGAFVYTGFRPAYVMVKRTDSTSNWNIFDNKRNPYNNPGILIAANNANPDASSYPIDFYANGFKAMSTLADFNASGGAFIYVAFAEAPFVNSNGVPCNAR